MKLAGSNKHPLFLCRYPLTLVENWDALEVHGWSFGKKISFPGGLVWAASSTPRPVWTGQHDTLHDAAVIYWKNMTHPKLPVLLSNYRIITSSLVPMFRQHILPEQFKATV